MAFVACAQLLSFLEEMISLGLGEEVFKSFPSGHTASAAMIFTIASLPVFLGFEGKKYLKYRIALWSVAAAFTLIVAVSRLIMGAHYLSDVSAGAVISTIFILGYTFIQHGISIHREKSCAA